MKKTLSIILIGLLLALTLTACHGSKETTSFEVPETFDENKKIEITFWAKNDTNKVQTNIYQKAIDDFQKIYPNVKVNIRLYTNYLNIYNDVITNIATQTTPNVCITYPDHIATYMTGENVVVPLDQLIDNPRYGLGGSKVKFDSIRKDQIVEMYLNECKIKTETYALPFMRSTEACYINKDLVEKLGYEIPEVLTWDFIWEVSEKAMEKNDDGTYKVNGQKVLIPFIYKSTDNMMIQYLAQSGFLSQNFSNVNGEIKLFNDTTEGFLLEIAKHAKTGAFSTFKISSYPGNFLNAGQCIFGIDSTAGATWMGSDAPLMDISEDEVVPFETEVRMIPQVDPSNPKMISQGPSICVFNKEDPDEVMASWLFAQYLLTNDIQVAYSQTEGYVPATLAARETADYIDYLGREGEDNDKYYPVKIKASKLLLENTDKTFVTSVFNGSASLRDAAGELIEDVTKAERRKQTVDSEKIKQFYSDVTSLYRLDSIEAGSGKVELGPLPTEAITMFVVLGVVWLIIVTFAIISRVKRKKIG